MTYYELSLVLEKFGSILNKFWNLLGQLTIGGLPFSTWLVGFFLAGLILNIIKSSLAVSGPSISGSASAIHGHRQRDGGRD